MRMFGRLLAILTVLALVSACAPSDPLGTYADLRPPEPRADDDSFQAVFGGVSTLAFRGGGSTVVIDGFFSRQSLVTVLFGGAKPIPDLVDHGLAGLGLKTGDTYSTVDGVFVTHDHFDHALDAPLVSRLTNSTLYGLRSTRNIALAYGDDAPPTRNVRDREEWTFGGLTVRPFASLHTPVSLIRSAAQGRIEAPISFPVSIAAMKANQNTTYLVRATDPEGRSALVHGSTNFLEGMYNSVCVDVVFLGVAKLASQSSAFVDQYWNEVVVNTGARTVVPIHWDDFFVPLTEPVRPLASPFDDFDAAMKIIETNARIHDVDLKLLLPFERIDLSALPRGSRHCAGPDEAG